MGQKVFVVHIEQIDDYEVLRNDVTLFANEDDAKEYAKDFIDAERDALSNEIEDGYWIEEDNFDSDMSWECYADGEWSTNRTEVSITEQEIK